MSVNELHQQLLVFRMPNGNTTTNLIMWLSCRLVNILVLVGLYTNYTNAKQAINSGVISINGVVVKDCNCTITTGDLITMPVVSQQLRNVEGLLINYNAGSIYVKAIPNLLNLEINQLDKGAFTGNLSSLLLDPLTH
jgi:ribosomal protein S4